MFHPSVEEPSDNAPSVPALDGDSSGAYDIVELAMIDAPQPVTLPVTAVIDPSHLKFPDPLMIGVTPCPGIGQECESPTLAVNTFSVLVVEADDMITPPWLLPSPSLAIKAIRRLRGA